MDLTNEERALVLLGLRKLQDECDQGFNFLGDLGIRYYDRGWIELRKRRTAIEDLIFTLR